MWRTRALTGNTNPLDPLTARAQTSRRNASGVAELNYQLGNVRMVYLLFAFDIYYPDGGMLDCIRVFEETDDAAAIETSLEMDLAGHSADCFHLVATDTTVSSWRPIEAWRIEGRWDEPKILVVEDHASSFGDWAELTEAATKPASN